MNIEPLELRSGVPLFKQVAARIKRFIQSSDFQKGDRIPTPTQLGKKLKVNELTVRRGIKLLIDGDILYTIKGKGTFITEKAVNKTILWLFGVDEIEGLSNYEKELFSKGRRMLEEHGYSVECRWAPESGGGRIKRLCDRVAVSAYCGAVVCACTENNPLKMFIRKNGLPHICFDDTGSHPCSISVDMAEGYRHAFEFMANKGHKEVSVICRRPREISHQDTIDQLTALTPRMRPIKLDVFSIFLERSLEYVGYEVTRELISNTRLGSALVIADDQLSRGVSRAILSAGEACSDIVVINRESRPLPLGLPVTYIGVGSDEMVKAGISLLLKQLGTPDIDVPEELEYRFQVA
ncbi:MAG: GntR family transcriptional regulator [Victivallales bacterium]|nr:GntR family transcriptional regulator [Victivallales bacterium]